MLWRRQSRPTKTPTTRSSPDVIDLVRHMAAENRLWGAERIRGELLKLGIRVAKRSVQRHLHDGHRPRPRPPGQSWRAFLRNHTVWACDCSQTYDMWFRPVFAFFIVDINTKQVVRVGVTRHPTAQWTAQQLREATPFGAGPDFLIRDNDGKFGADFDRAARGAGIRVLRTAIRAPRMNAVCERFLGSVRRECLDPHADSWRAASRAGARGVLRALLQRGATSSGGWTNTFRLPKSEQAARRGRRSGGSRCSVGFIMTTGPPRVRTGRAKEPRQLLEVALRDTERLNPPITPSGSPLLATL